MASPRRIWKRAGRLLDDAIRIPGVALLKLLRRLPLVRSRVIPWLVRAETGQMPGAHAVSDVRSELDRIARGTETVIVGPWLSEVGFELLYWLPFLNWATREFSLPPDQLIAVSRGGSGAWYSDLCGRHVDVFDLLSVEQYRALNAERWADDGHQKQFEVGPADRRIVELVRERLGLGSTALLHPSLMYGLYRYYWEEQGSISLLHDHGEFRRLPDPGGRLPELPDEYVAVRFYFRPSFPDTPDNRRFASNVIQTLAAHRPVVMLNTGLSLDDHADFTPPAQKNVHAVEHLMTPGENIRTQARIIANARALIGTYGGLSYLGPLLGVPTVGIYSDATHIVPAHLDMTERLSRAMGVPLVTVDTKASEPLRWVFDSARSAPGTR